MKTFADEMGFSIKDCAKQTLGKHSAKVNNILTAAARIEYFVYDTGLRNAEAHVSAITQGKFSSLARMNTRHKNCVDLANTENTILNIFFDLWRELGETIRSLIIGNYISINRSLRWIIESVVFWADMQTDRGTATEAFNYFLTDTSLAKKKEYLFVYNYIKHRNRALLAERLSLKEKYRKPSFGEICNKLSSLNGDKKRDLIKKELQKLYSDFSGFSHISTGSLPEFYSLSEEGLRGDHASYHYFEKYLFDTAIGKCWQVIDLVASVIILALTDFYGYKTPRDFLRAMATFHRYSLSFLNKRLTRKLPLPATLQ